MKSDDNTETAAPAESESSKKAYASPELDVHGNVETLTQKLPPNDLGSPAGGSDEADTR